ncbi:MAG: GNAT family N-acetyltransferase [Nitrospirota bacterium]
MGEESPVLSNVVVYRSEVKASDAKDVRMIAHSSGFFNSSELEVAVELVEEALALGSEESGYHFFFAERSGKAIGFTCYGPIPGTESSFDLYWIALMDAFRGMGIGKKLLGMTESAVSAMGGTRIYIETSAREQYNQTQEFYSANGYKEAARLKDFYAPGDSKIIYVKVLR